MLKGKGEGGVLDKTLTSVVCTSPMLLNFTKSK